MDNDKSFPMHGGDIYTEGRFKGIELIDFSSNINFMGIPETFKANINQALADLVNYPDLKYREVKFHIKEYLKEGTKEENIILGNGASEIIDLAMREIKRVCIIVPSFSEYEISAEKYCEKIVFCPLNEDFTYNYKNILKTMSENDCDGLIIGNPNNPNGGIIDKDEFLQIISYCEKHGKKIIIDEAFVEFVGDRNQSFINLHGKFKCLFIIRALTKFFSMPGIRFGYGISSDTEFIEKLSKLQIPWNINTFAEAAVKTVLKDEEYINNSKSMIEKERIYFSQRLLELKFVERIYESRANFLLLKLKGVSDEEIFSYCISKGILLRRCSNYRGLDDRFIRLAVKSRKDNDKLLDILSSYEQL